MHRNEPESVLRNLAFESGLHGSPNLFCDSRSFWPIFVSPAALLCAYLYSISGHHKSGYEGRNETREG